MTADNVNSPFRSEDGCRVFVDSYAKQARTAGNQGQKAPSAIALAEVLVDHRLINQAKATDHLGHALAGRWTAGAEGDHVRTEDRSPGAGAGNGGATAPGSFDLLLNCRSAQPRREPELVAAGDEDAGRLLEDRGPLGLIGMVAIMHEGDVGGAGAEFEKDSLVSLTCGFDRRRGRNDHDPSFGHPRERHEGGKYCALAEFVLGSANCHDRAGLPVGSVIPHAVCL